MANPMRHNLMTSLDFPCCFRLFSIIQYAPRGIYTVLTSRKLCIKYPNISQCCMSYMCMDFQKCDSFTRPTVSVGQISWHSESCVGKTNDCTGIQELTSCVIMTFKSLLWQCPQGCDEDCEHEELRPQ